MWNEPTEDELRRLPVPLQNSVEHLSCFSVLIAEDSAKPFASDDPVWLSFWNALDQPIAQTLMGSFAVVVLHVVGDRAPPMTVV